MLLGNAPTPAAHVALLVSKGKPPVPMRTCMWHAMSCGGVRWAMGSYLHHRSPTRLDDCKGQEAHVAR